MRQHPEISNIVSRLGIAALLLCPGLPINRALAQDAGSNVARISFVQGDVQLQAGQGNDFQQAVMNMPVLDGSRLQAGGDGEVEVEFGDGSVARLTPNSALQFDHLGLDQVQLEQLSGLTYFEFNVGDGHPPFAVQFANVTVQPTASSILRVGLDAGWEVAMLSGSANLQGNGIASVDVAANQSVRSGDGSSDAPYTVAQGINGDSWDNWNQDRDQQIAQEASLQTPVRDDSANPQNENWNDLDADGDWYPVQGSGNVWVPSGVGPDWDPYGAGYWGYYPTLGYTWISAYPWGWLPYHCGNWNYYSFGWGWAPGGGCGRVWSPVIVVRSHPPGWSMPLRPGGGIHPQPGQRWVAVDRGPAAKGPWGFQGQAPRSTRQQAVNFRGQTIAPLTRVDVRPQAFAGVRGTAPGTRAVLAGTTSRPVSTSTYLWGASPARAIERPGQVTVNPSMPNQGVQMQRPVGPAPRVQQPVVQNPSMQRPMAPASDMQRVNPQMQRPAAPTLEMQRPVAPNPQMQRPSVYQAPSQSYNQRSTYVPREPPPAVHYSAPSAPRMQSAPAPMPRMQPAGPHR